MNKIVNKHMDTLKTYVPVVARVHGELHPEIHDVKRVFDDISEKIESGTNLDIQFKELRKITDNYTIPNDVCESYEAVYVMLSELDKELVA